MVGNETLGHLIEASRGDGETKACLDRYISAGSGATMEDAVRLSDFAEKRLRETVTLTSLGYSSSGKVMEGQKLAALAALASWGR